MKSIIIIVIIFGSFITPVHAQSLFEYDRVDFFNSIEPQEKAIETPSKEKLEQQESQWAEPIVDPSGKVTIYVPPKEVRDFLDKPDPENAKAYLNWNMSRIKKFIIAQQLLEKEAKGMALDKSNKDLSSPGFLPDGTSLIDNPDDRRNHLFYFVLKGCPACKEETRILEEIHLNHPEINIKAFANGFSDGELKDFVFPVRQDNGMSQKLRIKSYPTILAFNEKKERYLISGYVDKEKILGLFQ